MSRENDLDLDAILAEFSAGEQGPTQPAAEPAPRRRRAEPVPPQAAPEEQDFVSLPREPRRPAAPARERSAAKSEPRPQPGPERRQASRRAKGRVRMAVVLAALIALLAGMLFWSSRAERQRAGLEPEPLRLELGQELEDYLDHTATTTR
ncbi:MAG: hypothetical protein IJK63_09940 [Oscillospiraceae bacterium]|nr:hypothetical protein [Oscillospiraceae bacterium]